MTHRLAHKLALSTEGTQTNLQDVDELIYLINHDLSASVRALKELPQWVAQDLEQAGVEVTGPVAQSLGMMSLHAERLDRMLKDLLVYSRIGQMQDVIRVDVGNALDLALAELTIPVGIGLTRDISCPYVTMGALDAVEIWNALIGNAIKHHHSQKGHIVAATQAEGGMIRFTVCDDGPGIPAHLRAKALGAMTTLRPRDEVEGTGMGLANLRKIAAHYGGYVTLSDAETGQSGLRVDLVVPDGVTGSG